MRSGSSGVAFFMRRLRLTHFLNFGRFLIMKKRILILLMVMCMVSSLIVIFPITASAVTGKEISDGSGDTLVVSGNG